MAEAILKRGSVCPYCDSSNVYAEFVDIGVGFQQVGPYSCGDCDALQMNPYNDNDRATEEEKRTGWWRGPPQPNPYDQEFENIEAIKANMLKQLELKRRSR